MIRKAFNLEPTDTDPTPDEIREQTEAIRKTWTPRERARRSGFQRASWMPPVFSDLDLPSYLAGDYEPR